MEESLCKLYYLIF